MHRLERLKPTVKWNSYTKWEVCVVPKSGRDILTALITARAHPFFHGLTELQQRFDCLKRTETGGNSAKSHSRVCVWDTAKLQWIKRLRDVKTKQHTEDFTQKWPDMQRSLHFIAVCHPAALVTPSWKQPWNPEDAQACPKQLSPPTRDQTTAMSRLNIVDSGILWTVLSLTFYHSVQHIMLVILQLRSNEKLTLKWYKKRGGEDPGISPIQI